MKTSLFPLLLSIFSIFSFSIQADGLSDLKNALHKLQGQKPIAATMKSSFVDQHDKQITSGEVLVRLNDNEQGFHVTYSTSELAKIAVEKKAKAKNEDALAPTLDAAIKLNAIELQKTLSSSSNLVDFIEQTTFISEEKVMLKDQEVRLLTFDLAMETLITNKRTRKYVDDFSASYQIWIKPDGTPVESKLTFNGSGSAYLVLSVEAYGENIEYYQVIEERLVLVGSESIRGSKSFFGDFERKANKELIF